VPSGDQSGPVASVQKQLVVSWRWRVPSAFMTQISDPPRKAILEPSGDQAGQHHCWVSSWVT
jgi:hypothetical protein